MSARNWILGLVFGGLLLPGAGRGAEAGERGLRPLPENPRYFEYRGKPFVSFVHQAGLEPVPVPAAVSETSLRKAARYGNHLYLAAHPTWVRATWSQLHRTLDDAENWRQLRSIAQWAHENDVILSIICWSYKWNYAKQRFSGSDMIWSDPARDGEAVVGGKSRRDLHELLIRKLVAATWEYPNVTYNFMWEYNVRVGSDPQGAFHRWWVGKMKAEGAKLAPEVEHLFSIAYGGEHPSVRHADFIVEEDGNGFWKSGASPARVHAYGLPLVYWSSDYRFGDRTALQPADVRRLVYEGRHPAETWVGASRAALEYSLQARWYIENIRSWEDELFAGGSGSGDELGRSVVPSSGASSRPVLTNPAGYTHGARITGGTLAFSCIYRDAEGEAPALAEVWVDRNGDGRFDPDPEQGERIAMTAAVGDFVGGMVYRASDVSVKLVGSEELRYVFRFADGRWNPPAPGGLVKGGGEGIGYAHWVLPRAGGRSGLSRFAEPGADASPRDGGLGAP